MKRNRIMRTGISLLLVFSMLLGVTVTGAKAWASDTNATETLDGYTRITLEDFGIDASTNDEGTKYTEQKEGSYTKGSLDKTYLDVDVNFHNATNDTRYFQYLYKSDWSEFIRVVHWGSGISTWEGANSNNSVWTADVPNNTFFNLKLALNIEVNANDSTKTDIILKIWVDNVFKDTLSFTTDGEILKNIYIVAGEETPISFRTPTIVESETEPPSISEALEGYTRVTLDKFEGLEVFDAEAGTEFSAEARGTYTGETLNKTYLDVDVNLNGTTSNYFHCLAEGDWAKYKRLSWSEEGLLLWDPDNTTVGSLWAKAEDYGVSAEGFFNMKLRTDITTNATDTTKEDVTLQLWINNIYVGEKTWTEDAHTRNHFYLYVGSGSMSLRIPTEQQLQPETPDISEELGGYTRVTLDAFEGLEVSDAEAGTEFSAEARGTYTGETLNKTYLDVDVNLNGTTSNYFHCLAEGDWAKYKRLSWSEEGLLLWDPDNTTVGSLWAKAEDYGVSVDGFFNMKLRTDITANATDTTKEDVTLQLWINNIYVGEKTWTEDAHTRNHFYLYAGSGSMSLRIPTEQQLQPETPDISDALAGYTRVTLNEFDGLKASASESGTTYTTEARGTYTGETLNKTYLDVDVNLNGTTSNYFHCLAEGDWAKYKRLSWSESGLLLWDPDNTSAGSIWAHVDSYQISDDEFFNVKIRTDITANAEEPAKEDVTLQLWINNSYVGEVTWTEDAHVRNHFYLYVGSGSMSLRTPTDGDYVEPEEPKVSEVLKDYTQVTPDDFAIVDGVFKHGWIEGNWMGYEYPESLNHAYLDVDIALPDDGNFQNTIRYLSTNGWESLQIGIVGDELRIFETSTNTSLYRVPLSEARIAADTSFNMKLSTDITVNLSDSTKKDVTLSLWINDKLVQPVTGDNFAIVKGCSTVGNMLGVYLPNQGTIILKTPKSVGGETQKPNATQQPDESFKKITFGNFAIKDGQYSYIGPELGAEGRYIFSVNQTVFSADFHFSKALGADFRYGGKGNPWNGLRFWTTGDGKLYMQDGEEKTDIYTFHPMYAGVQLVDNTFNMKLSVEFVDSDNDGVKDDVKLGVWFNSVLYRNSFIYLIDYAENLGNTCSVYVQKADAWVKISSDKTVDTGVDFTLFGFTKNWKQELGIK